MLNQSTIQHLSTNLNKLNIHLVFKTFATELSCMHTCNLCVGGGSPSHLPGCSDMRYAWLDFCNKYTQQLNVHTLAIHNVHAHMSLCSLSEPVCPPSTITSIKDAYSWAKFGISKSDRVFPCMASRKSLPSKFWQKGDSHHALFPQWTLNWTLNTELNTQWTLNSTLHLNGLICRCTQNLDGRALWHSCI